MRAMGGIERRDEAYGPVVLALLGEHDVSTAPDLRSSLEQAIGEGRGVVVDLSETVFLDSSVLHALIDADHVLRGRDGARPSEGLALRFGDALAIRKVFEVAGLLERFRQAELPEPAG